MQLQNQDILIVGASSGIGYAVAKAAKLEGARIHLVGRDASRLKKAGAELAAASIIVGDSADPELAKTLFSGISQVNHIYFAAGSFVGGGVMDGDIEAQKLSLDARVWGAIRLLKAAVPFMQPNGSAVLTGGLSTARPSAGAWATSLATATAEQAARALAVELAPVRVNAISPGWTDTPMWDPILGDDKSSVFEEVSKKILTGRLATASEVAEAVVFLFKNNSITGEVLHVDGGQRLT